VIRISQIKVLLSEDEKTLWQKAAKILKIQPADILSLTIQKKSIDARKKPDVFYSYTVDVTVNREDKILKKNRDNKVTLVTEKPFVFAVPDDIDKNKKIAIIGMGPAGLFCGYMLAKHGFKPVIYERGKKVEERLLDVERFWKEGVLSPDSNVQFGEGGAGTFSDGKLNTLVKDKTGRNREVLKIFVENGAPEEILYDNKPHIGTDILMDVIKNMREKMLSWGATIFYESKVTDFVMENQVLKGLVVNDSNIVDVDKAVLAIGHSARDTFQVLHDKNIPMETKSFAVGFRVQHPQKYVDKNQYGFVEHNLPAAPYKVTARTSKDRGVYSFCMCPGGYVVNASSEQEMCAINGMSYSKRDSGVANSAIVVQVNPSDYGCEGVLSGVHFQRQLERKAYELGKGNVPIQYYKDFTGKSKESHFINKPFEPKIKGGFAFADLRSVFSSEINEAFEEGMEHFGKIFPGFSDDYVLLAGVESRTSSPVRILRDDSLQSKVQGLYPCGEGAGYAGGITSAAMDGILVAQMLVNSIA